MGPPTGNYVYIMKNRISYTASICFQQFNIIKTAIYASFLDLHLEIDSEGRLRTFNLHVAI